VEKVHQILDLIRLKNASKGWHRSAAVVNLMFNLLLAPAFAYNAQIRAASTASSICAVAVLTPLLVKQGCSRLFARAGIGMNRWRGRLRQTRYKSDCKGCGTDGGEDSQQCFGMYLQRNNVLQ
jgi:hypothetical protein